MDATKLIRYETATLTLPLLDGWLVEVSPHSHSAHMRLMFAMADARLHMWHDNGHPDLTEADTKQLSSHWRGRHIFEGDLMAHDWCAAKREHWPESL